MAYRKPSGRKLKVSEVLPTWTSTHQTVVNMVFADLMARLEITDLQSYFRRLRVWIVIGAVIGSIYGAATYGFTGFVIGAALGLTAPAAILWLGILLIGIAIFIAIYVAAWAVILWVAWWLLHS